jgi:hypothetical protein
MKWEQDDHPLGFAVTPLGSSLGRKSLDFS